MDLMKRFFDKVDKNGPNDCWEWTAYKNNHGYGRFNLDGKIQLAHRVSWILHNGAIPDGMCVCHTCDNPSCVNPDHLFLGSHTDNMKDRSKKGRDRGPQFPGESNPKAKLTEEQVLEIRALRGKVTVVELAARYGVGKSHISKIQTRKIWAHI